MKKKQQGVIIKTRTITKTYHKDSGCAAILIIPTMIILFVFILSSFIGLIVTVLSFFIIDFVMIFLTIAIRIFKFIDIHSHWLVALLCAFVIGGAGSSLYAYILHTIHKKYPKWSQILHYLLAYLSVAGSVLVGKFFINELSGFLPRNSQYLKIPPFSISTLPAYLLIAVLYAVIAVFVWKLRLKIMGMLENLLDFVKYTYQQITSDDRSNENHRE